jgi:hypothetical protein
MIISEALTLQTFKESEEGDRGSGRNFLCICQEQRAANLDVFRSKPGVAIIKD